MQWIAKEPAGLSARSVRSLCVIRRLARSRTSPPQGTKLVLSGKGAQPFPVPMPSPDGPTHQSLAATSAQIAMTVLVRLDGATANQTEKPKRGAIAEDSAPSGSLSLSSGGRASNPRPQAWEACALPTELPPRCHPDITPPPHDWPAGVSPMRHGRCSPAQAARTRLATDGRQTLVHTDRGRRARRRPHRAARVWHRQPVAEPLARRSAQARHPSAGPSATQMLPAYRAAGAPRSPPTGARSWC